VTVDDIAKNFKVHIFTARERLHRLEQKGLLKRFKVGRSYTGSQRYSGVDFFRALNIRGNEILYYSDEKKFIELLSKVAEVDLNDRGAKRSLTALFRDNNLPDELIDLFYKLKSSFSTSTSPRPPSRWRDRGHEGETGVNPDDFPHSRGGST
jgi:DNA-binding Lrp family transcriptional regulator